MDQAKEASEITKELVAWAKQQVPKVQVAAISVGQSADSAVISNGIAILLIRAAPRIAPRIAGRASAVLALDYLIAVRLADPLAEHSAVAALAFAALDSADFELASDLSVTQACQAIGLAPCAGIVLRAEARRDRVLPHAPLVREPAVAMLEPLVQAEGTVVGPGNVPIAGAVVTLDDSSRAAITGPDGRFRFALPAGSVGQVTVRARSHEARGKLSADSPTLIPLPMEA